MLVMFILVFLSLMALASGAWLLLRPSRARQRLDALVRPQAHAAWRQAALKVALPLARLSAPDEGWSDSPLRLRFFHAGIRSEDARYYYFGAKTALPVLLGLLAYALAAPGADTVTGLLLVVVLAALAGTYLPNLLLHLAVSERQEALQEQLPDAVDLLLVCVEAGLGIDAAMARVTEEISGHSEALAQELHLTALEMRAGSTREQALRNLATRTGVEPLEVLATMLTQAEKFGTGIGDSLRVFTDDLRHRRQVKAEERAAKVPTKMLFPLVFCIFPSIIGVILGPAVVQIVRSLGPAIGGQG